MRRLLYNFIKWINKYNEHKSICNFDVYNKSSQIGHNSETFRINVHPAVGCTVIEIAYEDKQSCEYISKLYTLDINKDFSKQLSEILLLEIVNRG